MELLFRLDASGEAAVEDGRPLADGKPGWSLPSPDLLVPREGPSRGLTFRLPQGRRPWRLLAGPQRWHRTFALTLDVSFPPWSSNGVLRAAVEIRGGLFAVLAADGRCGILHSNRYQLEDVWDAGAWLTRFTRRDAFRNGQGGRLPNRLQVTALEREVNVLLNGVPCGEVEGPRSEDALFSIVAWGDDVTSELGLDSLEVHDGLPEAPFSGEPSVVEVTAEDRLVTSSGAPSAPGRWVFWVSAPSAWVGTPMLGARLRKPVQAVYADLARRLRRAAEGETYQLLELSCRVLAPAERAERPWEAPGQALLGLGEDGVLHDLASGAP